MFQDLEAHVYVVLTEKDCVCEFKYLAVTGFFFLMALNMNYKAILRPSHVT